MSNSKSALVIANALYQDAELRQLVAPVRDGLDLAELLHDPRIGGFRVRPLIDESSQTVRSAVEDFFADRKSDELVLLYFSGHGIKDEDGKLFFAASDTRLVNKRLRRSSAVEAAFVSDAMRRCSSRRQVLLLDCCYSGAFPQDMTSKGVHTADIKERFEGKGRIVLTASNSMQSSFEGGEGDGVRSFFTSALVEGLRTGKADTDGDGFFSLDEIYAYVHDRLLDIAPHQHPLKFGYIEGRVFLARNPLVTKPVGALNPTEVYRRLDDELADQPPASHGAPARPATSPPIGSGSPEMSAIPTAASGSQPVSETLAGPRLATSGAEKPVGSGPVGPSVVPVADRAGKANYGGRTESDRRLSARAKLLILAAVVCAAITIVWFESNNSSRAPGLYLIRDGKQNDCIGPGLVVEVGRPALGLGAFTGGCLTLDLPKGSVVTQDEITATCNGC